MRKTKGSGLGLMIAGTCLLICALAIVIGNMSESRHAETASQSVLASMQIDRPPAATAPAPSEPPYRLNPAMEMPTETIDGHAYIGILEIPELSLSLPVMSDWSYPKLKIAPGRYHGSAYTGDLIICAHNYERHFGQLNKLSTGVPIRFTDMSGNTFVYEIQHFEQLGKYQTHEMLSGEWDLTLFTCATGGQKRITIRCTLIEEIPAQ